MTESVSVFMAYGVLFFVALGIINELTLRDWHPQPVKRTDSNHH